MTIVVILYVLQVLSLGIYTLFCLSRHGWRSWATPCLFSVVTVTSLYLAAESLGRAKPYLFQLSSLENATIIGIDYEQNVAIYYFLRPVGWTEPVVISLPWSDEAAAEANRQQRRAEAEGKELEIGDGRNGIDDDEEFSVRPRRNPVPPLKRD